jgi:hypothetical protein
MSDFIEGRPASQWHSAAFSLPSSASGSDTEGERWKKTLKLMAEELRSIQAPDALGRSHLDEDKMKAVLFTLEQFRAFANKHGIFQADPIEWSPAVHHYEAILKIAGEHPDEWYEYPPVLNLPNMPAPQN